MKEELDSAEEGGSFCGVSTPLNLLFEKNEEADDDGPLQGLSVLRRQEDEEEEREELGRSGQKKPAQSGHGFLPREQRSSGEDKGPVEKEKNSFMEDVALEEKERVEGEYEEETKKDLDG